MRVELGSKVLIVEKAFPKRQSLSVYMPHDWATRSQSEQAELQDRAYRLREDDEYLNWRKYTKRWTVRIEPKVEIPPCHTGRADMRLKKDVEE